MKKRLRNILISLPTIVVFIATLLLLTYIGYGEASRTYLNFQLKKLKTQAEIIRNELEPHLNAGLPLIQFSGFHSLSKQLLISDSSIENIQVVDSKRNRIFLGFQDRMKREDFDKAVLSREYEELSSDRFNISKVVIESSEESYRVLLSLENKFEHVGYIVVEALKLDLLRANDEKYEFVFYSFIILSICFLVINLLYELVFVGIRVRDRLIKALYIVGFVIMSIIIGVSVFYIYKDGVESQTKALSDSIAQRINAVFELGINIEDISGINDLVKDYKEQNPDISRIVMTKNNLFHYHTDSDLIGKDYYSLKDNYEYVVPLKSKLGGDGDEVSLSFSLKRRLVLDANIFVLSLSFPVDVVTKIVLLNAKNFIVLFISCGLIALIFLKAGTSFISVFEQVGKVDMASLYFMSYAPRKRKEDRISAEGVEGGVDYSIGIDLIKPVYFLVVFVNALSISFLPRLVTEMAQGSSSSLASASLPFTVFYIFFAFILLPAGQYAERGSLRRLMAFGFLSEVIGLGILIVTDNYWLFVLGRAFSGVGQGLFLIGLQSYLLVIVPRDRKTEGASVKVFGRNAALIAGASIGALLYSYIDSRTVFIIAFFLSVVGVIYLQSLIPEVSNVSGSSGGKKFRKLFGNIGSVFKDLDFVRTFFLVGLLGKMSITGVVMFAVPILLIQFDFAPEDIGQALMLYYISSMFMNQFVSGLVRRLGGTNIVLFMSALVGGIGMFVFGLIGITTASGKADLLGFGFLTVMGDYVNNFIAQVSIANFRSYLILVCLVLAGISNGLLTAPIITHISNTRVAQSKGDKSITATYTFLERSGHVMGPMAVSYLFTLTNQSQGAIAFFGVATIVFGVVFMLFARKKKFAS